ncbi:chymotrypsin-like [Armigeres subalbatus]|uniref:chymotrypsin-like n=1 Tax=Armigeres subalbatus TaxID=124917 RepID=UPI002ED1C1CA
MKQFTLLVVLLCFINTQAAPDRTSRIINGRVVPHKPYNVFIMFLNDNNSGFFGGGTIISNLHILTAAANIVGFTSWTVRYGSNIFSQLNEIVSTTATPHPEFDSNNRLNDIGVITLPQSLTFHATVSPAALPSRFSSELNLLPLENEQGTIVGFGFTSEDVHTQSDVLWGSFQRVIDDANCQRFYTITLPRHFCATDNVDSSNVCNGEIGAGFITDVRGLPTVTGVASQLTVGCGYTSPTAYTRVEFYREWINTITSL